MTVKEAILTLNANAVFACERAGFDSATVRMIEDALYVIEDALEAQEPVEPMLKNGWYWCGGIGCRNSLTSAIGNDVPALKPNYCEKCGRKVKWDG